MSFFAAGAQAGAAADHLPEFGLAHNLLEEHQIQTFRNVNTGVQHIHGNSNLGQLLRIRELVDQALSIVDLVIDDFSKTGQMGM